MNKKNLLKLLWLLSIIEIVILSYFSCSDSNNESPIPGSSAQLIVMLTESPESSRGILYKFERKTESDKWSKTGNSVPVVIGRNGLAWGKGLHQIPQKSELPIKREGDGRSPAGVFRLGPAFGALSVDSLTNLKISYLHLSDLTECIDDINSEYYNQIVDRSGIQKKDWDSSEKMLSAGIYYAQGVFIQHNTDPVEKGNGSCIFLHNWKVSDETTSGCTAMSPEDMKRILYWLDDSKMAVIVQLTKDLYRQLNRDWNLPGI